MGVKNRIRKISYWFFFSFTFNRDGWSFSNTNSKYYIKYICILSIGAQNGFIWFQRIHYIILDKDFFPFNKVFLLSVLIFFLFFFDLKLRNLYKTDITTATGLYYSIDDVITQYILLVHIFQHSAQNQSVAGAGSEKLLSSHADLLHHLHTTFISSYSFRRISFMQFQWHSSHKYIFFEFIFVCNAYTEKYLPITVGCGTPICSMNEPKKNCSSRN